MVTPAAGEVVLVPFPFSDLSQSKVRPAVCLADAGRGDRVLCQITSSPYGDSAVVPLDAPDFASGGLLVASFAGCHWRQPWAASVIEDEEHWQTKPCQWHLTLSAIRRMSVSHQATRPRPLQIG